ncbi:peptidase S8/S53 domain-containing protein [Lactarius quietus]|nr:peptidase S8/S53 domain-containing protein [Lactarius quietus]
MRSYNPISVLSFVATVLLHCYAKPTSPRWDDMRTVHSWNKVPENWMDLGHPSTGTTIDLHVALRPHRESALIDALYEVSDPSHPRHCRYGAHLTKEQVAELAAPHPHTLELVRSWLIHQGIPLASFSMTHGGNTLTLTNVSIIQANKLLGASYQLYKHVKTNETIVRTIGYALPAVLLHNHVWTVVPTTHFDPLPMRGQKLREDSQLAASNQAEAVSREPVTALSSRDDVVTSPAFLRRLYNTWGYTPAASYRNMLAIVGYLWHYPSPTDLRAYMEKYRTDGADGTFAVVQVNYGGYDPSHPFDEANLDLQYAQAMAYPTSLVFYSTGRGPVGTGDWYLSWLGSVLDLLSLPRTISTSYVNNEVGYERGYARFVCYLYAQLGARGVSLLFSTDNFGVGQGNCVTDDGSIRFTPGFPATCPWVTAVGGTTSSLPEWAAPFSGGGFSDYFERPIYQQQAAATFLRHLGTQYDGLYNASGRGILDVAAQATGFRFFQNGLEISDSGTSGSTPIVAAIISMLNDYRLSIGRPPLGFLNPWLYGGGLGGLNDITGGSNPGCGTPGFSAVVGWDPVTGLGTPDFQRLQQTLVNEAG